MPSVTIDGREFDIDALSDEAKQQLSNLHICDQEIALLNLQLAIAQTARATHSKALNEALGVKAILS